MNRATWRCETFFGEREGCDAGAGFPLEEEMNMKHNLTFALTLILLLTLVSLPATAQAAAQRFRGDSGVVTLGANQVLRLTVGGINGTDMIRTRVRWMQYGTQSCSGTPVVCRHLVVSQGATPLATLGPEEALSFDVQQIGTGVRAIVESNNPSARVTAVIFDTATQQVISMVIMANTEGD